MPVPVEVFLQQCKRRFGTANPERMRLAHWEWMVRSGEGPYRVRMGLGLEPNYPQCGGGVCRQPEPDWCFQRFGMSRTRMADGRILCIAGEHEDWYDPDFCIYNDVIVLRPEPGAAEVTADSGEVEVYGYPQEVFPPTDFHSATLVGTSLYMIGRLGYQESRRPGHTPITMLDTDTYRIAQVEATGPCPGWVYKHHGSYDPARHAISVRGGEIVQDDGAAQDNDAPVPINFAAHRLHLADMRWEVISSREKHRAFQLKFSREPDDWPEPTSGTFRPRHVAHTPLEMEHRGVDVHRIDVQGVRIKFTQWVNSVDVLVEGELPPETTDAVLSDVIEALDALGPTRWTVSECEPHQRH